MQQSREILPFDALTSALGGRKLYSILWGLWLFLAVCGHYALMLAQGEASTPRTMVAIGVGVIGILVYSWLLIRGLASKTRRNELFMKRMDIPSVSLGFRILVLAIPVLGLGALLAPAIIK